MINSRTSRYLLLLIAPWLWACTNAVPVSEQLANLSQPLSINGKSSETYPVASGAGVQAMTIAGQCDARLSSLEFSFDEVTWQSSSTGVAFGDDNCADGNFSLGIADALTAFSVSPSTNVVKYIYLRGQSVLGASSKVSVRINFTISGIGDPNDTNPPIVINVSSDIANGTYKAGTAINLSVQFSKGVIVTGTPTLTLNSGATANYVSNSSTDTLVFQSTVAGGQDATDLDVSSAAALSLNGGTILDGLAIPATLTMLSGATANSLAANKNIVIDTTAPVLTGFAVTNASPTNLTLFSLQAPSTSEAISGYCILENDTTLANCDSPSSKWEILFPSVYTVTAGTGAKILTVFAKDAVGNISVATDANSVTLDTSAPTILGVTGVNANGAFKAGDAITLHVQASQNLAVLGSPILALNNGGFANFTSVSGDTMTFTYIVASGQDVGTLDYAAVNSLTLNGGSIKNTSNTAVVLSLPAPSGAGSLAADKSYSIDSTAPSIASVTVTNANPTKLTTYGLTYGAISEAFTHYCILENSTVVGGCAWVASASLPSTYSVTATQNAKVLSIFLKDAIGNVSTHFDSNSVTLDTVAPTVLGVTGSNSNGTYKAGAVIALQVLMSEAVTVTGTPKLALNNSVNVNYASGSGTSTLVFNYTVGAGQDIAALDYAATNSLTLNGGSIVDLATTNATLTLPALAAAGSLGVNRSYVIDTTAPTLASATVTNATPTNATTYNLTYGALNEAITQYCILENSTAVGGCSWTAGASLPATYSVAASQGAKTLSFFVQDAVGNISARVDANAVTLDTVAPSVTNVTGTNSNGAFKVGDVIGLQVVMSESVLVTGTPHLTLNNGVVVNYTSGSGTNTLLFNYTVSSAEDVAVLDYALSTPLTLNGGSIKDAATSDADLSLAAQGAAGSLSANKSYKIDTIAPTLASAAISNSNPTNNVAYGLTYGAISEAFVQYCILENSTAVGGCSWTTASSLPVSYTASATENAKVLSFYIKDAAGNISSRVDTGSVTLDTTAPTVTLVSSPTSNGSYFLGSTLNVEVTFSEGVVLSSGGVLKLTLETGTTDAIIDCSSVVTDLMTCLYNIGVGQTSSDLNYQGTSSLALNGATVIDAAGNAAVLTLPATGGAFSLASQKNLSVGLVTVAAKYSAAQNWNDYVNTGTNVACTDTGTTLQGKAGGCEHGGELKLAVLTGIASCTGLTATDSLGVFNWTCDASSGDATIYSNGFNAGKGLRDLVNTTSWKNISLTVLNGSSQQLAVSTSTTWWNNTVTNITTASPTLNYTLGSTGQIYTINSNLSFHGFVATVDKVALVTLGSTKILPGSTATLNCSPTLGSSSSTIRTEFCIGASAQTRKYIWIEADADFVNSLPANQRDAGLIFYSVFYSRVHNSHWISTANTANVSGGAIFLNSSKSNLFTGIDVYRASNGIYLNSTSNYNSFDTINIAYLNSATNYGISLAGTSIGNRFVDYTIANLTGTTSAYGVTLTGTSNTNTFARGRIYNLTGTGSASWGIYLNGSGGNIFSQQLITSCKDAAINFAGTNTNNIFSHITAAECNFNGVQFATGTTANAFNSLLLMNSQLPIGGVASAATNTFYNIGIQSHILTGINVSTSGITASKFIIYETSDSISTVTGTYTSVPLTTWGLTNVYVGNSTDTQAPAAGLLAYTSIDTLSEWVSLDNPYRTWGFSGTLFTSAIATNCTTSNCQVRDYRVRTSGYVTNKSASGNATNTAFPSTNTACPTDYLGNDSTTQTITATGKTFMRAAIEIDGDGIGDDNFLCENGESCIYAPNVGVYQGEGSLSANYCTTTPLTTVGYVHDAKLYKYSTTAQ